MPVQHHRPIRLPPKAIGLDFWLRLRSLADFWAEHHEGLTMEQAKQRRVDGRMRAELSSIALHAHQGDVDGPRRKLAAVIVGSRPLGYGVGLRQLCEEHERRLMVG